MKPKTKDRLMTAGVVLLIAAGGFSLPGCTSTAAMQQAQTQEAVTATIYLEEGPPVMVTYIHEGMCTTDTDCEMREALRERPRTNWKVITGIALSVIATGYLYDRSQRNGGDQRGIDKGTPTVGCVAAGCAL